MTKDELNAKIREEINRTRDANFGFNDPESIIKFESRIDYLKNPDNHFSVMSMLGPNKGHATARKALKKKVDANGDNFLRPRKGKEGIVHPEDVKGVYVWFCDSECGAKPFYVGIGGKIINRLYQHVGGVSVVRMGR